MATSYFADNIYQSFPQELVEQFIAWILGDNVTSQYAPREVTYTDGSAGVLSVYVAVGALD